LPRVVRASPKAPRKERHSSTPQQKRKEKRKNPTIYNNRHPPKRKKENRKTNKLQSKTETLGKSAGSER
jgi:hypothetical protein